MLQSIMRDQTGNDQITISFTNYPLKLNVMLAGWTNASYVNNFATYQIIACIVFEIIFVGFWHRRMNNGYLDAAMQRGATKLLFIGAVYINDVCHNFIYFGIFTAFWRLGKFYKPNMWQIGLFWCLTMPLWCITISWLFAKLLNLSLSTIKYIVTIFGIFSMARDGIARCALLKKMEKSGEVKSEPL